MGAPIKSTYSPACTALASHWSRVACFGGFGTPSTAQREARQHGDENEGPDRDVDRRPNRAGVGWTSAVGGAKEVGHVVAHYKLKGDQNEHGPVQRDLARAVGDRRRRDFLRILSPHRPSASL